MIQRRGIILAGGSGSRLYPATLASSKQLLPVYDKPMIYYPLSTLMLAGIRDIMVISTPVDTPRFEQLLGTGEEMGIRLTYAVQPEPKGLAQSYLIAEEFVNGEPSALILGDNIFWGAHWQDDLKSANANKDGATIFSYHVHDPERYGIVTLNDAGKPIDIEEKPTQPRSRLAVTGLYFYDGQASEIARRLKPSPRGELEITDVNRVYLEQKKLEVIRISRGSLWLDTGTPDSLLEASQMIAIMERHQHLKIGCPEEIAWRMGWVDDAQLRNLSKNRGNSGYGNYLLGLLDGMI
ncbi:MAG TPA: glucose-1-phosphate thymidylyltransferase RfbA [Alphaproteobacteria bacterium]|nr:glucose-1-phosphate thymidylyltransferase RfbA [Alphaproteobacteria bacterium]